MTAGETKARSAGGDRKTRGGSLVKSFTYGIGFLCFFGALLTASDHASASRVEPGVVLPRIVGVLIFLLVLHFVVLRHLRSPYYAAHTVANALVCVMAAPDLAWVLSDPVAALSTQEADTWPIELCAALHFYHVFAYTDLRFVDYLHHVLMVFICMPLFYAADYGPLQNYSMFFISGLPGGVDYALLALARSGRLRKLTEKKWNTSLNIWIRGPFLIGSVVLSHVQIGLLRHQLTAGQVWCRYACEGLVFWNAMYFTESVVGDYYRLSLKRGKIALYHDLSDSEEDGRQGGVRVTEEFMGSMSPRQRKHPGAQAGVSCKSSSLG
eukprot:TRINITY_DN18397_c0_g1_i1.p1 TRINITY_DN18397_c0_g1~~TRINITY_DN18397_c0_g1_i1.p1  ORF type:complete len:324 (+),score=87.55 TRINITY_DN18397_c0_g1_i1:91-1062(+)